MQKLHFSRSQVAKLFAAPPSTARLTLIQQERRLPFSPNGDNSKLRKKTSLICADSSSSMSQNGGLRTVAKVAGDGKVGWIPLAGGQG